MAMARNRDTGVTRERIVEVDGAGRFIFGG
jgi:hypothetical protein